LKCSAYTNRAIEHIRQNTAREIAEYSEHVISVSENRRWDYAIPDNYTNYRDGFLWQDSDPYRGQPLLNYNGEILYLHLRLEYCDLADGEVEKYLLFDRHGRKYTFVTMREEDSPGGNPSYFEFLPRVKKYAPTRAAIIRKRLNELKNEKEKEN
jgi:hypothetical protein